MSENQIIIKNLSKVYKNGFNALKTINLNIKKGEIFAMLGPNGAGKTTLISIICGIVKPSSGKVTVDGFDIIDDYKLEVSNSKRAYLRGLDKMRGSSVDLEIPIGQEVTYGSLIITVEECRYPVDNPTGDAFSFLKIFNSMTNEYDFQGWMIASSPALMALDHARYDIWLIRCKPLEELPVEVVEENLLHPATRPLGVLGN